MITAEGIVGKLVSFIVNKTIGKLVDLPFDKRKKACRALTKLYYCVQTLDDVTDEFYESFNSFESSGISEAMVNALNNNAYKINLASNMFIELGEELHAGLEIIDPALADSCGALYISKFDFLTFMSNSVEWVHRDSNSYLKVKAPLESMLDVDLEQQYQEISIRLKDNETFDWPSTALDDFSSNTEVLKISFENDDAAKKLKKHLDSHRALLKSSKESLRNLLKDNFSIEEVLFQNDSHPWR